MSLSDFKQNKTMLRIRLREKLHELRRQERVIKSRIITGRVLKLPSFVNARRVFIYVSTPAEAGTAELIRESLRSGKEVYVPLLSGKSMTARRIYDFKRDLLPGAFGILEPAREAARVLPSSLDFAAVPGLGFDRKGGRLGRGAGYYDRFLIRAVKAYKAGLAFREQICRNIPMEAHDVYMDDVITD